LVAEPFIVVLSTIKNRRTRYRKLKASDNPYGSTFMYLATVSGCRTAAVARASSQNFDFGHIKASFNA